MIKTIKTIILVFQETELKCGVPPDMQTRKREVTALHEAMVECGIRSGIIVSRSEEKRIVLAGGEIMVMPVWKFLFDPPG